MDTEQEKWMWKADWCKTNRVSPYNVYFWDCAEQAWLNKDAKTDTDVNKQNTEKQ